MRRQILTILYFLLTLTQLEAEYINSGADTVINFIPGSGQSFGQEEEYFPENVLGLPDTNGTHYAPSSDPSQICSIGIGGEIILGFRNYIIIDGEGVDFTIFENAFLNPVTSKVFAEPAKIAVSREGLQFVEFPFDYLTLEGCAGVNPTNGKADPFDPDSSGRNSFDLKDIGMDSIRYIKITDICQFVLDNPAHPYYDPIISGFDLDALVSWHLLEYQHTDAPENKDLQSFDANLRDGSLSINAQNCSQAIFWLYDINGMLIHHKEFINTYQSDLDLSAGAYILVVRTNESVTKYYSRILLNN